MLNEKQLIYKNEARAAVLRENSSIVHCIDRVKVVDAVEVVRCKNCKYYNSYGYLKSPENLLYRCRFGIFNNQRDDKDSDHFCSFGERREEE